jgi:hypothetical protein
LCEVIARALRQCRSRASEVSRADEPRASKSRVTAAGIDYLEILLFLL